MEEFWKWEWLVFVGAYYSRVQSESLPRPVCVGFNEGGAHIHFSMSCTIYLECFVCFSTSACPTALARFQSLPRCLGLLIIPEKPQAFICQQGAFHGRKVDPATPRGGGGQRFALWGTEAQLAGGPALRFVTVGKLEPQAPVSSPPAAVIPLCSMGLVGEPWTLGKQSEPSNILLSLH